MSGREKRPPGGWDPRFDADELEQKHGERVERRRRPVKRSTTFTCSRPSSDAFREVVAQTRSKDGPVTFSQMLELLVAHWHESPPDATWVLQFDFQTKRGRPR